MRTQEDTAFEFEAWMQPGVDAFNYWISFFPTAPLFGVEWRFGESMEQFMPGAAAFGVKPPAESAEVVSITTARARVAGVEETEVVEPAAEAVADAVDATADTVVEAVAEAEAVAETPEPAIEAAPAPKKPKGLLKKVPADADDLKLIKGVGPGLETQLNGLGVYRFRQLAKFSEADLQWVDENLTSFKGRCFRDDWIGQAKGLMG